MRVDPLIVLSPHFDDAALSCGQLMAGRPDVVVVTAFTGTPNRTRMLTSYDKDCGFHSAGQAMLARRLEDRAAMDVMEAAPGVHLGLLDNQYDPGKGWTDTIEAIAEGVAKAIYEFEPQVVVGPVGIAHPDHLLCAAATRLLAGDAYTDLDWWLYEDLPSRVLYPDETHDRLEAWREFFPHMTLGFLGTGGRARKAEAIECYRSQLWALDPPTYLVPERFHRLRPCSD